MGEQQYLYYPVPRVNGLLNPNSILFDQDKADGTNSIAVTLKGFTLQLNLTGQAFDFSPAKFFFVKGRDLQEKENLRR